MQERTITDILKNKKQMIQNIAEKRRHIYEDLKFLDEQLSSANEKEEKETYGYLIERQISRMQNTLRGLKLEECRILLVWESFYQLDHAMFELMNRLYVKKETWYTVESELHVSHEYVKAKRKEALGIIREAMEQGEDQYHSERP
ncbi:hypothetical protein MCG98_04725 [Ruminococcus sp. OA3]|uniref:hypothetical protein n=1 Tax=Ruminococcus sp. OA3 TaxID=2914164 RepID=UPI001F05C84C|nr:hypothetical protein [Ruminococcus sp. OA3]MCH1981875.1 hypothetical protein [Ruminococcus sp. OA3]